MPNQSHLSDKEQMKRQIEEEFEQAVYGVSKFSRDDAAPLPTLRDAYLSAKQAGMAEELALKYACVCLHEMLANVHEHVVEVEKRRPVGVKIFPKGDEADED